ncbi:5'-3' exonuclease [Tuberibacillus sp. Marseille-P3662]|uniref:5'-3' exonuclease n=1 Tax=Tuberibacillus sp. Marseille-P3662 TaxID=1965358 RepID=UPI000A1CD4A0|nr:5'-3' exonuclease H3TH domain-containing protein [Tuberibacillus sp. Marseille-P3662]
MAQQTLLLVDGFNLLSRGYFATSYGKTEDQLYRNSQGLYTGGLRVFLQKLFALINQYETTHVAIAWDVKREETDRRQNYAFYKATRGELPEPLIEQYHSCKTTLERMGIKQIFVPQFEADDVIGALAKKWSLETNGPCYIYSNDRDLFQLLDERTSQIIVSQKKERCYTLQHFHNDYAIEPYQWVDVKALLGDKSDNLPGCPGVGEKSALPLIQQYGSLESIYESIGELDPKFNRYKNKLIDGRESATISKDLAQIICDIPDLDRLSINQLQWMMAENVVAAELDSLEIRINYRIPHFHSTLT